MGIASYQPSLYTARLPRVSKYLFGGAQVASSSGLRRPVIRNSYSLLMSFAQTVRWQNRN